MSFIIDNAIEFLHVPKTAGMWICHVCRGHIEPIGHRHGTERYRLDLPSFAVARSPYPWLRSARATTQRVLDTIAGKNSKGFFGDNEFRKIGSLKTLREVGVSMDAVLEEYLRRMPGEYSRVCLRYFENATHMVDSKALRDDLRYLFSEYCDNAPTLIKRLHNDPPVNASPNKRDCKSVGLVDKLIEAEQVYYDYTVQRGVEHD